MFRTNVPKSYVENVGYRAVHKMGFCVEETKELYHVKVVLLFLMLEIHDCVCNFILILLWFWFLIF